MKYVSASKLKAFRLCPYSLTLPFKTSPQIDFGTAVHKGLETHMRGGDFLAGYRGEAGKLGLPLENEEEAKQHFEFAQSLNIDKDSVLALESEDQPLMPWGKHNFQVPITDEWGVCGAMDIVYVNDKGELVIADWKTGNSKEDDDLQLAIYALAAYKLYPGFDAIKTMFVYTKQRYTQTSCFSPEKLVGALEYLAPLAEAYFKAKAENRYPRQANKYCCYCAQKESCPVYKNLVEAEPYMPSYYDIEPKFENLEKLFQARERASAIRKAGEEIEYCLQKRIEGLLDSVGGKIKVNGRTYELKEKVSRYEYNGEAIFNGLAELLGKPPMEAFSFTPTGANAIKKTLDKEQKKTFQAIVDSNKEVKSKAKTIAVNIDSEPVLVEE